MDMIIALKIVLLVAGYLLIGALCSFLDMKVGHPDASDESNIYFISLFWPFWFFMVLVSLILIFPGWFTKQLFKVIKRIKKNDN